MAKCSLKYGMPIPVFSHSEAAMIKGVDQLQFKPTWKSYTDVASLKNKIVRLKFRFSNARLYAFQVRP